MNKEYSSGPSHKFVMKHYLTLAQVLHCMPKGTSHYFHHFDSMYFPATVVLIKIKKKTSNLITCVLLLDEVILTIVTIAIHTHVGLHSGDF